MRCSVNLNVNLNRSEETIIGAWSWEVKFPKCLSVCVRVCGHLEKFNLCSVI